MRWLAHVASGAVTGWAPWLLTGEPGRLTGMTAAVITAVLAWPFLILAVLYGLPWLPGVLVPRSWRIWWRYRPDMRGRWLWWRRRATYGGRRPRAHVPAWLARAVLRGAGHRCLFCRRTAGLQVEHIRPWAAGGRNTLWNLTMLCARCNRVKSNYWAWPSGRVSYRAWPGAQLLAVELALDIGWPWWDGADIDMAAEILAAEITGRRNPARWLRAALVLI